MADQYEYVTRDRNGVQHVETVSEERARELLAGPGMVATNVSKSLAILDRNPTGQLACYGGYLRHASR